MSKVAAQFRIPGRTGASCVKPFKVRLMRGRNESMRALELVKHCCCALNCVTSTQKTKMLKNIQNWQMLDVFQTLSTTQTSIIPRECQNESGVCDGLYPVVWTELILRGSPGYICSIHFEGGLGLTKLNPLPSIFSFPQHLRWNLRNVILSPRRDVKSSERKHRRPRGVRKC